MREQPNFHGDCHLWSASLPAPAEDPVMTRFSDQMRFCELEPGTRGAGSDRYERHQTLAVHLFEDEGWDPDEVIGLRCEMELSIRRSEL